MVSWQLEMVWPFMAIQVIFGKEHNLHYQWDSDEFKIVCKVI